MDFYTLSVFIVGLIATFFVFMVGRKWALRVRFIDRPGGRKKHQGAVPPIGGLIIIPIFTALYFLTVPTALSDWPLFFGLFILLIMGVLDDRYILRSGLKFVIQIIVATFIIVIGGDYIQSFGNIFGTGDISIGFLAVPFSVACLVMMMNAINMIDGLDGLAAGVSFVVIILLLAISLTLSLPVQGFLSLIIPLSVFLFFNMRHPWREKAAVFLGDSGSLTLGLILGWMCIRMTHQSPDLFPPVSVIWILAVPVIDALMLFFLRITRGRHPFTPDRNHLHHRFLLRGFTIGQTTLSVMGVVFLCGCIGMSITVGISEKILFFLWILGVFAYIAISLRRGARREFNT